MENWKKKEYGSVLLKMGMSMDTSLDRGITRPLPVPTLCPNFFGLKQTFRQIFEI